MAVLKIERPGRSPRYAAVVDYRDEFNRKRQIKRMAATRREAERLERELYRQRDAGGLVNTRGDRSIFAYYTAQWLDHIAHNGLRPLTVRRYRELLAHAEHKLGAMPLTKITPLHVLEVYRDLAQRGRSQKTILNLHRVLQKALRDAVRFGLIPTNVMDRVDAPRAERYEHHVVTRDELRRIFDAADGTEFGPLVRVLALTGLRLGEALGLTWDDIDNERISVRRTIDTRGNVGRTKTARGTRVITLSPEALAALGPRGRAGERIFPFSQNVVRHAWHVIRANAGVPRARIHDLRHAHATHLLNAGLPVTVISARLGHADPSVTMRFYAHDVPGADAELAAVIDNVIA